MTTSPHSSNGSSNSRSESEEEEEEEEDPFAFGRAVVAQQQRSPHRSPIRSNDQAPSPKSAAAAPVSQKADERAAVVKEKKPTVRMDFTIRLRVSIRDYEELNLQPAVKQDLAHVLGALTLRQGPPPKPTQVKIRRAEEDSDHAGGAAACGTVSLHGHVSGIKDMAAAHEVARSFSALKVIRSTIDARVGPMRVALAQGRPAQSPWAMAPPLSASAVTSLPPAAAAPPVVAANATSHAALATTASSIAAQGPAEAAEYSVSTNEQREETTGVKSVPSPAREDEVAAAQRAREKEAAARRAEEAAAKKKAQQLLQLQKDEEAAAAARALAVRQMEATKKKNEAECRRKLELVTLKAQELAAKEDEVKKREEAVARVAEGLRRAKTRVERTLADARAKEQEAAAEVEAQKKAEKEVAAAAAKAAAAAQQRRESPEKRRRTNKGGKKRGRRRQPPDDENTSAAAATYATGTRQPHHLPPASTQADSPNMSMHKHRHRPADPRGDEASPLSHVSGDKSSVGTSEKEALSDEQGRQQRRSHRRRQRSYNGAPNTEHGDAGAGNEGPMSMVSALGDEDGVSMLGGYTSREEIHTETQEVPTPRGYEDDFMGESMELKSTAAKGGANEEGSGNDDDAGHDPDGDDDENTEDNRSEADGESDDNDDEDEIDVDEQERLEAEAAEQEMAALAATANNYPPTNHEAIASGSGASAVRQRSKARNLSTKQPSSRAHPLTKKTKLRSQKTTGRNASSGDEGGLAMGEGSRFNSFLERQREEAALQAAAALLQRKQRLDKETVSTQQDHHEQEVDVVEAPMSTLPSAASPASPTAALQAAHAYLNLGCPALPRIETHTKKPHVAGSNNITMKAARAGAVSAKKRRQVVKDRESISAEERRASKLHDMKTRHEGTLSDNRRSENEAGMLKLGAHVEALFDDGDEWYTGTVSSAHLSPTSKRVTYGIAYDDGDNETHVPANKVRLFKSDEQPHATKNSPDRRPSSESSPKAVTQAAVHANNSERMQGEGEDNYKTGAENEEAKLRPSPLEVNNEGAEVDAQYSNDFFDETLASMLSARNEPQPSNSTANDAAATSDARGGVRARASKGKASTNSRPQETSSKDREVATGVGEARRKDTKTRVVKESGAAASGEIANAAGSKERIATRGPKANHRGSSNAPDVKAGGKVHEFSGAAHWINGFDSRFDDALKKASALDQL